MSTRNQQVVIHNPNVAVYTRRRRSDSLTWEGVLSALTAVPVASEASQRMMMAALRWRAAGAVTGHLARVTTLHYRASLERLDRHAATLGAGVADLVRRAVCDGVPRNGLLPAVVTRILDGELAEAARTPSPAAPAVAAAAGLNNPGGATARSLARARHLWTMVEAMSEPTREVWTSLVSGGMDPWPAVMLARRLLS